MMNALCIIGMIATVFVGLCIYIFALPYWLGTFGNWVAERFNKS